MAADNAAAVGGRVGITFDVELVIPWDAPKVVVDLNSDVLIDLGIVPDVIGLTGRWPEAAVCHILPGRDVRSVRALVPDSRGLKRNFHDVTIVDMGDLPEVSVSMDDLSLLRRQWPTTMRRHMVWLQQDLDTMRAETWHSCGRARCHGVRCGKVHHRIAWIMFGGRMMCHGTLSPLVWRRLSPRGQFGARFGRIR